MRIALVDDQQSARADLAAKLTSYYRSRGQTAPEMDAYESGEQLGDARDYDLVFLDVLMPGPDGVETARVLRKYGYRGDIVFTTAVSDYVFEAFSVEAADYLVKPLEEDRLAAVMDRVMRNAENAPGPQFVVEMNGVRTVVNLREAEYCEVSGRRLTVYRPGRQPVEFRGRMDSLAEKAGPDFFRCHRSYLVNLGHVASYADGQIELMSGARIPLSRLREHAFREALMTCLGRKR